MLNPLFYNYAYLSFANLTSLESWKGWVADCVALVLLWVAVCVKRTGDEEEELEEDEDDNRVISELE